MFTEKDTHNVHSEKRKDVKNYDSYFIKQLR